MSNEIDPAQSFNTENQSNVTRCKPHGSRHLEDIPLFNLLGLRRPGNAELQFGLLGDNHHMTRYFPPNAGHTYVKLLNPNLASVESLLENLKGPSVLWLRGCDQLFLQQGPRFPFEKFKTLTALEISGVAHLITLPKEISELTQLQTLNLSHLPIQHFPADDFFSKLTRLHSLVLRGCPSLRSVPKLPRHPALEYLHLSDLLIETLSTDLFYGSNRLRFISFRGCSKLHSPPYFSNLGSLKVLDLSHCIALQDLELHHPFLDVLDLSYTDLHCTSVQHQCLTHAFFRDAKGSVFDSVRNAKTVEVLDLSGAQHLGQTILLKETKYLKALDLSRTSIESLDFLFVAPSLRILLLRNCSSLVKLPAMGKLPSLEVLDISSCGSLCDLPEDLCEVVKLKELNLSGCTSLTELRVDVFANLTNLRTHLILPDLSSNQEIAEVASDEIGGDLSWVEIVGGISSNCKPNEFHLISTFSARDSSFDRFKRVFTKLEDLISNIQRNIGSTNSSNEGIGSMLADVKYIREKLDILETSDNRKISEQPLDDLESAAVMVKADAFPLGSKNLTELLRTIVKLKLLIPCPKRVDNHSKKEAGFVRDCIKDKRVYNDNFDIPQQDKENLLSSYNSLTETQRNCLLYFAFPGYSSGDLLIRDRILIQLWCGEGFINAAQHEENVTQNTVEETGQQILKVLLDKGFIEMWQRSRFCVMGSMERSFLREQAKAERFFDFNDTPELSTTGFQRVCLLKSRPNLPSSCNLLANYTNSCPQKLQGLKNVRALLNVNEKILDIRPEWFSMMRNLTVFHLGRCDGKYKYIDVMDSNFMEELKNMKQLRLLSLERVAAIGKLPYSICNLTDLKVLNLRQCSDLEELPAGIGNLKNLVLLDLTDCPLLSMLPKGIKLLSKLEVLKGFIVIYDANGRQCKKACTLADLFKLQNLRKLSLYVNIDKFPSSEDLRIFKEMKNLYNLKITWLKNTYIDQRIQDAIQRKASTTKHSSRWQQMKCCGRQNETEEPLRSDCRLDNLKKLVLCCFPFETPPNWLNPSELHNLEKLSIIGGHLKTLPPGDTNQNSWNVKVLYLKYLDHLEIDRQVIRQIFPNMTYLKVFPDSDSDD